MNIFFLSRDPEEAARFLVDKHVVKMPTESAQMLSTAKRLLDGAFIEYEYWNVHDTTSVKKMWLLPDEEPKVQYFIDAEGNHRITPYYWHPRGFAVYKPTHANHPSTVWTRSGKEQYEWHLEFLKQMQKEYTRRYKKVHLTERLLPFLNTPSNIPITEWTDPPLAMPPQYFQDNHVQAYRRFYISEKSHIAVWKDTNIPEWFKENGNLL